MTSADMTRAMLSAAMVLGGALGTATPQAARAGGNDAVLCYRHIDGNFETVAAYCDSCTDRGLERAQIQSIPGTQVVTELYGYCRDGQVSW